MTLKELQILCMPELVNGYKEDDASKNDHVKSIIRLGNQNLIRVVLMPDEKVEFFIEPYGVKTLYSALRCFDETF